MLMTRQWAPIEGGTESDTDGTGQSEAAVTAPSCGRGLHWALADSKWLARARDWPASAICCGVHALGRHACHGRPVAAPPATALTSSP